MLVEPTTFARSFAVDVLARVYDPSQHPRNPAGALKGAIPVGGWWRRKLAAEIGQAIEAWVRGEGDDNPLAGFPAKHLRVAARAQNLPTGGSHQDLSARLLDDARAKVTGHRRLVHDRPAYTYGSGADRPQVRDADGQLRDIEIRVAPTGAVSVTMLDRDDRRMSIATTAPSFSALRTWAAKNKLTNLVAHIDRYHPTTNRTKAARRKRLDSLLAALRKADTREQAESQLYDLDPSTVLDLLRHLGGNDARSVTANRRVSQRALIAAILAGWPDLHSPDEPVDLDLTLADAARPSTPELGDAAEGSVYGSAADWADAGFDLGFLPTDERAWRPYHTRAATVGEVCVYPVDADPHPPVPVLDEDTAVLVEALRQVGAPVRGMRAAARGLADAVLYTRARKPRVPHVGGGRKGFDPEQIRDLDPGEEGQWAESPGTKAVKAIAREIVDAAFGDSDKSAPKKAAKPRAPRAPSADTPRAPRKTAKKATVTSAPHPLGVKAVNVYSADAIHPGMSDAEYSALRRYIGSGRSKTNEGLRVGEVPPDAAAIDSVMRGSRTTDDTTVYRGLATGRGVFGPREDWPSDFTGFEWTDTAFVSTSGHEGGGADFARKGVTQEPGVLLRIRVPRGTGAVDLSAGGMAEDELLLDRGLRFRVVGELAPRRVNTGSGMARVLDVEVIPAPHAAAAPRFTMPADVDQDAVEALRTRLRLEHPEGYRLHAAWDAVDDDSHYGHDAIKPLLARADRVSALRVAREADVDNAFRYFVQRTRPADSGRDPTADLPPVTVAELESTRSRAGEVLREEFRGKPIAVRMREADLAATLRDGRIKTVHETGRSGGLGGSTKRYREVRSEREEVLFGIPRDAPARERPVYGYVVVAGRVQPVTDEGDMLDQYGDIQVVLRPSVRGRTTASEGDSIDEDVIPSPIDNPSWESFGAALRHGDKSWTTSGAGRYPEAQIHGGVSVDDIEEVVLPAAPSAALAKQLDGAGVSYRVLRSGDTTTPTTARKSTAKKAAAALADTVVGGRAKPAKKAAPKAALAKATTPSTVDERQRFDEKLAKAATGTDSLASAPTLVTYDDDADKWTAPSLPARDRDRAGKAVATWWDRGQDINEYFRDGPDAYKSGGRKLTATAIRRTATDVDRLYEHSHLTRPAVAWRGFGGRTTFGADPDTWPDDLTGQEWVDPGYVSTAASRDEASNFVLGGSAGPLDRRGVMARILLPEGAPVLSLSEMEATELLLSRGWTFRVVRDHGWVDDVRPSGVRKHRLIDVEATPPSEPSTGMEATPAVDEFDARTRGAAKGKRALSAAGVSVTVDPDTGEPRLRGLPATVSPADSEAMAGAARRFGLDTSSDTNRVLRARDRGESPEVDAATERDIADLRRLLSHSTLSRDVVVYRGTPDGSLHFGDEWSGDLTGREWSDPAFASTSVAEDTAHGFMLDDDDEPGPNATVLRILAPRGTSAVATDSYAGDADLAGQAEDVDERELLLAPARYRVVRDHGYVTRHGDRVRRLDVEVVPSGTTGAAKATPRAATATTRGGKDLLRTAPARKSLAESAIQARDTNPDAPHGDEMLHAIADRQGFTTHPRRVDKATFDTMVSDGAPELWRGMETQAHADQLVAGDYRASGNLDYGSGYSLSQNRMIARTYGDDMVRVTLAPDARIVDLDEVLRERDQLLSTLRPGDPQRAVFADPGRYAAARGIDVIRIRGDSPDGGVDTDDPDFLDAIAGQYGITAAELSPADIEALKDPSNDYIAINRGALVVDVESSKLSPDVARPEARATKPLTRPSAKAATGRPPAKPVPIRDLIDADDATIETALRDVFEGRFGPYTTKVKVGIRRAGVDKRGREVELSIWADGEIFDEDGNKIGYFEHSISPATMHYGDMVRREIWADIGIVQLGEGDYDDNPTRYHGKGFGSALSRRAFDWYRASGVHGVSLSDHNGYVWAAQGFNFSGGVMPEYKRDQLRKLVAALRARKTKNEFDETIPKKLRDAPDLDQQLSEAEALLARLESTKPGEPGYPTAYEVSQLGRRGRRGKTGLWLGKFLGVSAGELILNPDEGEVVT